jgi:hypothetical protein
VTGSARARAAPDGWVSTAAGDIPALIRAEMSEREEAATAVAAAPLAAVGADSGPVLSLVVVLSRQPTPETPQIAPLVTHASLALDVVVGLSKARLAALERSLGRPVEPLFSRCVRYRLHAGTSSVESGESDFPVESGHPGNGHELASAEASGPLARAALTAQIGRDEAVDALGALRGQPSRLWVSADLEFDLESSVRTTRLRGTWADVSDALAGHALDDRTIDLPGVAAAVRDLLDDERLHASADAGQEGLDGARVDVDEIVRAILPMSAIVMDRVDDDSWRLRPRPDPTFPLDYVVRLTERRTGTLQLEAAFDELLAQPLRGRSLEPYVRLVAPGPSGGEGDLVPVQPRTARRAPREIDGGARRLASVGDRVESVALIAEPHRAINATAAFVAASAATHRPAVLDHLVFDDLVLVDPAARPQPLPIVEDAMVPIWNDRFDPRVAWFAPAVELVLPSPGQSSASSPFVFRFRRTGTTNDARPALDGTILLTVRRVVPPGAAVAAAGRMLREVPLAGVGAALEVPFVDSTDGIAKRQALDGSVRDTPDGWAIEVRVQNAWLRLCYRALSGGDPSAEPATLRVDYVFPAYVPVRTADLQVAMLSKAAVTEIAYAVDPVRRVDDPVVKGPVFDPRTFELRSGDVGVSFRREVAEPVSARAARLIADEGGFVERPVDRRGGIATLELARPSTAVNTNVVMAHVRPVAVVKPLIRPVQEPVATDPERYGRQSIGRRTTADARVSCTTHGTFYRETVADGEAGVGCRDELQLGIVRFALFDEIVDLRTDRYAVHRHLQQPGRFLLVPSAYGITRHEPEQGERSYRPCIALYAVLDPEEAGNDRVVLDTSLQPDVAVHERDELAVRLRAYDAAPRIQLPTEIEGVTARFDWGIPGPHTATTTIVRPGGVLRLTVEADLADWLLLRIQLQSGTVNGTATFELPDGTKLTSGLVLDLAHVQGPWLAGPIEVTSAADEATLRNRVDRTVDVAEVVCTGPAGRSRVAVGQALAAGGSTVVAIPADTTGGVAVATLPRSDPIAIEETRSFIDEVETNVLFISLVALANHGLGRLDVAARIRGVDGVRTAQLTDTATTADVRFVLPLTTYLTGRVLEYRLTPHALDGTSTTGAWITWDLAAAGNVISLSWTDVQPSTG